MRTFLILLFMNLNLLFSQNLIPFREGQLWGYKNNQNVVMIKPQFYFAYPFESNVARVRIDSIAMGLIDMTGKVIMSGNYLKPSPFYDGYAYFSKYTGIFRTEGNSISRDDAYYIVDTKGKIWNPNKPFSQITKITDGTFGAVELNKTKYSIYDLNANPVIKDSFDVVETGFKGGYAIVGPSKRRYTVIDKTGKILFDPIYSKITFACGAGKAVAVNESYSSAALIDVKTGTEIGPHFLPFEPIHCDYYIESNYGKYVVYSLLDKKRILATPKNIEYLTNKLLLIQESQKGIMSLDGNILVPEIYTSITAINDSLFIAEKKKMFGVITKSGVEKVPLQYKKITQEGLFIIGHLDKSVHIFSLSGEKLWSGKSLHKEPMFDDDEPLSSNPAFLYVVNFSNSIECITTHSALNKQLIKREKLMQNTYDAISQKWGVTDEYENILVPFEYDYINPYASENIYPVKKDNKWGYFSILRKKLISSIEYDQVYLFRNNYGAVQKSGKWGLIDTNGKIIIPIQYDKTGVLAQDSLYGITQNTQYNYNLSGNIIGTQQIASTQTSSNTNSQSNSQSNSNSQSQTKPKANPVVRCVSFLIQRSSSSIYLYMVEITDNSGNASEQRLINVAKNMKFNKNGLNGYSEKVLVDKCDCQKAKQMATQSGVRYDNFQIDSKVIE